MGAATDRLEVLTNLSAEDLSLIEDILTEQMPVAFSKGLLERAPGKKDNWIEANGSLPAYIEEVANSLHTKRGMPISKAIAVAISRIKKWAVTGEPETKAKAVKALAEWAALRAKAAANRAKKD